MNTTGATFEVLAAGALSSVQDRGRSGHRALGVGQSGAVDRHSALLANLLVGNAADAALLEITMAGPRLRLHGEVAVALAGAEIDARASVDAGDHAVSRAVPMWRPVLLRGPLELALGACRRGTRAYLAVAGGIAVPHVLGSCATDLRGGFGGIEGAPLRAGQLLECAAGNGGTGSTDGHGSSASDGGAAVLPARWWINAAPELDLALPALARMLPGTAVLDAAGTRALFARPWRVAVDSNRTGLRLQGPPLSLAIPWTLPSEPVVPGTVQLPPDGQPIVLLHECGTLGGYPRIGHVDPADLPRIAQLRPGEALRFVPTTLAECDARACAGAQRLARITLAIEARQGARRMTDA